jgi:hypothetical protein
MKNTKAPMKLTGTTFVDEASEVDKEKYRQQMVQMFGCSSLPAVQYKGELIPARVL